MQCPFCNLHDKYNIFIRGADICQITRPKKGLIIVKETS